MLFFVQRDFQASAEPIDEQALSRAMRNIQDAIPKDDLAIQIDLASEMLFWENVQLYRPWFHTDDRDMESRKKYTVNYVFQMISQIGQDVEVKVHNCYGESLHK